MSTSSPNFELFNDSQTKNIAVVVCIEGLPFCFANRAVYSKVKYGDPGIVYGLPGLVYGALKLVEDVTDILSLDQSSLLLQQAIEPEQGKSSISAMNLTFIDKNQLMTQVITPGVYLDDILGKPVKVYLGYQEISFPQDYLTIFRGFITSVRSLPGAVTLGFSDANVKKRQALFFTQATRLSSGINNVATTIPVQKTDGFYQHVLGPDGTYDTSVKTYIKVDDEYMLYGPTGVAPTSFTVTRAQRGTLAAAHDINADVSNHMELSGHAIDLALKVMLSGWNGPYMTDIQPQSVVATLIGGLGNIPNSITFPSGNDVKDLYGLTEGDYVSMSGATPPANNFTNRKILQIIDVSTFEKGRIIVVDGAALAPENAATGTVSFRSKYDTLPTAAGSKMRAQEIDVQGHEDLKAQFLGGSDNNYRFFLSEEEAGKTFIESQLFLPIGCYTLTKQGRISVNITKPPLAQAQLVTLSKANILNPQNLRPERAVNSRTFFNDIAFVFDFDDDGNPVSKLRVIDTDSLSIIGLSSLLKIESRGLRTDLSSDVNETVNRRATFLLSRYKNAAMVLFVDTNYGTGNQIEAGDVVALDGTDLFISNFLTGDREFGTQLFEVVDRKLNIASGVASLKLISGVGAQITDRYATVSPSSFLDAGSTTTVVKIRDSFTDDDPKFPGQEYLKWQDFIGLPVAVHSEDYSFYEERTLVAISTIDPTLLTLDPPLSAPPPAGYVLDIARYPTTTDPTERLAYKQRFGHINPTLTVVTGISATQFTLSAPEAAKLVEGRMIRVHNALFSDDSGEVEIQSIVGVTITVESMGFTPAAGYTVELCGYADGGGPYRWV